MGVAVEEVLQVDKHPASLTHEVLDRVAHHREVLLERCSERLGDVTHIRLRDQSDRRRLSGQQRLHLGIVTHRDAGPAGRAEGHEVGALQ